MLKRVEPTNAMLLLTCLFFVFTVLVVLMAKFLNLGQFVCYDSFQNNNFISSSLLNCIEAGFTDRGSFQIPVIFTSHFTYEHIQLASIGIVQGIFLKPLQ